LVAGVEALDSLKLRYAIVGGLAVGVWAVPRATQDVDIYAEIPPEAGSSLEQELRSRGFHVPAMREELERFGVFRSRSSDGVFLDIFDAVGPLGEAIIRRRRQASVGGYDVWVIAPEDLALLKAFSDRSRDFDDLVVLLRRATSRLDMDYIKEWAKMLDASIGGDEVSERVQKALKSTPRK
jgi:predicted nucleotidyltransferase